MSEGQYFIFAVDFSPFFAPFVTNQSLSYELWVRMLRVIVSYITHHFFWEKKSESQHISIWFDPFTAEPRFLSAVP